MSTDYRRFYELLYKYNAEDGKLYQHREVPESGVYCVVCGEHSYIGSSVKLNSRIRNHINTIFYNGSSGCSVLKTLFEKNNHLEIYLLSEEKDIYRLRVREQEYINLLKPDCNVAVAREQYVKFSTTAHKRFAEKVYLFMHSGATITMGQFKSIPKIGKGTVLEIMFDEFVANHKDELSDYIDMYERRARTEPDWW